MCRWVWVCGMWCGVAVSYAQLTLAAGVRATELPLRLRLYPRTVIIQSLRSPPPVRSCPGGKSYAHVVGALLMVLLLLVGWLTLTLCRTSVLQTLFHLCLGRRTRSSPPIGDTHMCESEREEDKEAGRSLPVR